MSSKSRCKSKEERIYKVRLERSQVSFDQENANRPWVRQQSHHPFVTNAELETMNRNLDMNKRGFVISGGHAASFEEKNRARKARALAVAMAASAGSVK